MGQEAQAQIWEVQAGGSRDQPLVGTAKLLRVVVDRVAGTMDPATRETTPTPTVTPGATTLTKMTGIDAVHT